MSELTCTKDTVTYGAKQERQEAHVVWKWWTDKVRQSKEALSCTAGCGLLEALGSLEAVSEQRWRLNRQR